MSRADFRRDAAEVVKQTKADLRAVMEQCEELSIENARLKERVAWLERQLLAEDMRRGR